MRVKWKEEIQGIHLMKIWEKWNWEGFKQAREPRVEGPRNWWRIKRRVNSHWDAKRQFIDQNFIKKKWYRTSRPIRHSHCRTSSSFLTPTPPSLPQCYRATHSNLLVIQWSGRRSTRAIRRSCVGIFKVKGCVTWESIVPLHMGHNKSESRMM